MKGKNNYKIISVSLVIALASVTFGLVGNVIPPSYHLLKKPTDK